MDKYFKKIFSLKEGGLVPPSFFFTHQQGEAADVVVPVVIPVVVVAVEAALAEAAEVQPVAVRVQGQLKNMPQAVHATTH